MRAFWGYLRTLRQYLATPKGSHDFRDDCRALCIILLTMAILWALLNYIL